MLTPQGLMCAGMHRLYFAGGYKSEDVFPGPGEVFVKIPGQTNIYCAGVLYRENEH